jgi:hypothetical protein
MFTRFSQAALIGAILAFAPLSAESQVSLSFHIGLFDGVGVGIAATHWHQGSIFRPGFRVGLGVGAGFGIGVSSSRRGYYFDDYYDDYYYDDYHDGYYFDDYYYD